MALSIGGYKKNMSNYFFLLRNQHFNVLWRNKIFVLKLKYPQIRFHELSPIYIRCLRCYDQFISVFLYEKG